MGKYLRTQIMERLNGTCATFVSLPQDTAPHRPSVRYLTLCEGLQHLAQAIDSVKEGQKARKRIIVRPSRHRPGLHELYTYHFPKTWSAACVENRELIKKAQRLAHAVERDHSWAALQWRVQFFHQYYTLPAWHKEKPSARANTAAVNTSAHTNASSSAQLPPEKRRYPHFYSYVFATIYYTLKAAAQKAAQPEPEPAVEFEPVQPLFTKPLVLPSAARFVPELPKFEPISPQNAANTCIFQKKSLPLQPI